MPPIWDTLTRPGQPVAQSTSLFTQYPSRPPHTSPAYFDPRYGLRSWSRRSYTDPRLVSSMMGEDNGGSDLYDILFSPIVSTAIGAALGYKVGKGLLGSAIGAGVGYGAWRLLIGGSILDPSFSF